MSLDKSEILLPDLMAVCVEAAGKACETIRMIHRSGCLCPIEKGDGRDSVTGSIVADLQTEADRQSEIIIFSVLRKHLGANVAIVGEEESSSDFVARNHSRIHDVSGGGIIYEDVRNTLINQSPSSANVLVKLGELTIFVDPLDGTREFINGQLPLVTVLIGVSLRGSRLCGVIAKPFSEEGIEPPSSFMYGVVGIGSFLDHKPLVISDSQNRGAPENITIITSNNRSSRVLEGFLRRFPAETLKEGGAGSKCWRVASGAAHCYLYVRPGTKKWDILAGDAIISAMGGVVSDACGRPFYYTADESTYNNDWGLMASLDRALHFNSILPACYQALLDAAHDKSFSEWPSNLEIPPSPVFLPNSPKH